MGGLVSTMLDVARGQAAAIAEAASAAPGAAEAANAATGPANPPRTVWAFFVRAWRPFCGWMIGAALLRSALVPVVQLIRDQPVETTDWTALAAMAGVLFITRSYERSQGIS